MKKISVVLIDDNKNYRGALENFLTGHGVYVIRGFTHDLVDRVHFDVVPDIAIISFDTTYLLVEQTVAILRKKYPSVKILINSIHDDRSSINKILELGVDGFVFKIEKTPEQDLLKAVEALHQDRNFFWRKKNKNYH